MYKEIMFRPLTRAGELAGRIREMIRYKARALLYIGGNDVLPPPLAKDEEAKRLEKAEDMKKLAQEEKVKAQAERHAKLLAEREAQKTA